MGRTILVLVILFTAIFASIILTVSERTVEVSEAVVSSAVSETNVGNIGAYALNWAVKELNDGNVNGDTIKIFDDWHVLGGDINNINYDFAFDYSGDTTDAIQILANVSWVSGNKTVRRRSEAVVRIVESAVGTVPITNAIAVNGDLSIRGHATINGPAAEHAEVDFYSTFGVTKEAMKIIANNHYINPPNNVTPVTNITWIDSAFHISDNIWGGSGILVVNGDLTITGGSFSGVIWVIGTLFISGNPVIDGGILAECGAYEVTTVTGTPVISFDADDIELALSNLPLGGVEVVYWSE